MDRAKKFEDYLKAAKIHRGLGVLYVIMVLVFSYLSIESEMWGAPLFFGVICALHFLAYHGLSADKGWGKALSGILALILLFGFPIGTILGASILFYMFRVPKEAVNKKLQPTANAPAE